MSGGKTVIELRVHGVSGTPPEAMLGCPKEFLEQVAGDDDAGFFRRPDWVDRAAMPPDEKKWWRRMEAYSWGGLTSRKATRAVWLLFLPFSLVNLAHWMLPIAARPRAAGWAVRLLRLLALSFTLTLLAAMAAAVLDIIVWQCTSIDYCNAGWGPLALLSSWPMGVRLAIGAVPLVMVIVALWRLGREEATIPPDPVLTGAAVQGPDRVLLDNTASPPEAVVSEKDPSPLTKSTFWNRDDSVGCMRACHVTAWTASLGALVLAAPVSDSRGESADTVDCALLIVNLVLLALSVLATASTTMTGRGGTCASARIRRGLHVMRWWALVVLAMSLVWVAASYRPPKQEPPSFLPGLQSFVSWLTAAQALMLLLVLVCLIWSKARLGATDGYEPTLKGYTAWFVALLGWLIGIGFSAAVGLWTAQTFGTWVSSVEEATAMKTNRQAELNGADVADSVRAVSAPAPLIVPPVYVWTAVAALVVIGVAFVAAFCVYRRALGQRAVDRTDKLASSGPDIETNAAAAVLKKIRRSRQLATLTDRGINLAALLALVAAALGLAAIVLLYLVTAPAVNTFVRDRLGGISVTATVAIISGFVGLVVLAARNRNTRRTVAILWDVITFWPRANHPLTPPSYGGRTVFDLRLRMRVLRESEESAEVILVAHSQGTVIAAATMMQATESWERYPLLTFGSPLRRLYARNFPAYFNSCALENIRKSPEERTPRWMNLWALTDPIGSWVFDQSTVYLGGDPEPKPMVDMIADVDCRIFDVMQLVPRAGLYDVSSTAAICGHSGFWNRGEYIKAVCALQTLVVGEEGVLDMTSMARSDQM